MECHTFLGNVLGLALIIASMGSGMFFGYCMWKKDDDNG